MQETHGDRLGSAILEELENFTNVSILERLQHASRCVDPFAHALPKQAVDERRRGLPPVVPFDLPRLSRHLENVLEPARGYESSTRSLSLEHGVRRHGRSVREEPDGPDIDSCRPQPVDDSLDVPWWR